jgi:hypothetical protein
MAGRSSAVPSSARPAGLEAYHDEAEVIAGYLSGHADDLDRALDALRPTSHGWMTAVPDASAVRDVVARMRSLAGWVQGVAQAFAAAGGGGLAVGATSTVTADATAIERTAGIDPQRPYRLTQTAPRFEEDDESAGDILRDHIWDGIKSLVPGGETPAEVAIDTMRDLAERYAPEILNQMLSMRAYGRAPDYIVAEADAFSPFYGLGGGAFITYSRSGEIFVAPEAGVGVPGAGVSVRAGWLDQQDMPSGDEVEGFIDGFAVTGSVGAGSYSVAATWNAGTDLSDVSYEEGPAAGMDPGSLSVSYSADVGDSGFGWTD